MKKLCSLVLVSIVILSFTSCKQKQKANSSSQISSQISSQTSSMIDSANGNISSKETIPASTLNAKAILDIDRAMLSQITGIRTSENSKLADQYVVVSVDGLYGLVNYNGEVVLPIKYKDIHLCYEGIVADGKVFSNNLKTSKEHQGHGFEMNVFVWDTVTDKPYNTYMGVAPLSQDMIFANPVPVQSVTIASEQKDDNTEYRVTSYRGLYGFMANGKLITSLDYECVHPFSDGLAAVKKNGLWGYINETGKVVLDFQYSDIFEANIRFGADYYDKEIPYQFSSGYAAIVKNGKWGYIDKNGKEIIPFSNYHAITPYNGRAWLYNEDGRWIVIDLNELSKG